MADVFISYSHKDRDWVSTTLLAELEGHGFSVMIDFRDFQTGSFGVDEMQRGVIQSRHLLLVLTPAYVESEWTKFENAMAQTLDPGAVQRRLIPVLRETCVIPLRLSAIHYRDLRTDDAAEWDRLFRDLT